jgi:hypothetical protein
VSKGCASKTNTSSLWPRRTCTNTPETVTNLYNGVNHIHLINSYKSGDDLEGSQFSVVNT